MSAKKKNYETKRALRKGFNSLHDYIESKLETADQCSNLHRVSAERKFWKKHIATDVISANGELHPKAVTIPFFDINYYTGLNPKYEEGVSTQTSREMMEHFLKWINNFDLEKFEQGYGEHGSVHCTNAIKLTWEYLLGKGTDENGIQTKSTKFNPEPFKWFNELEHLITNTSIFWGLIEEIWVYGSHFLDMEQVFSRNGRDKVSLTKRQYWLSYKSKVRHESTGDFLDFNGDHNTPFEFTLKRMREHAVDVESDGEKKKFLPLFRAFKFRNGKAIRKGVTKYSGDERNTGQEEGASWSYSSDKFNASIIGWNINTHHFKKHLGMTDKDAWKHMVKKGFVTKENFRNNPTFKDGYRTALGVYLVEERDILFITSARGENEFVVKPSKPFLIDYHIMGLTDFIAMKLCLNVISRQSSENNRRGNTLNASSYFDVLRTVVFDLFKTQPNTTSKFLKLGLTPRNMSLVWEHFKNLTGFDYSELAFDEWVYESQGLEYVVSYLSISKHCPSVKSNIGNVCRPKTMKDIEWREVA